MQSSGSLAFTNADLRAATIAKADLRPSLPLLKITAFPDLRHKPPASLATLGRLSKINPMTPRGVETLEIFKPFGRSQFARIFPTGSAKSFISSNVLHMLSKRSLLRVRRSIKALSFPLSFALVIS